MNVPASVSNVYASTIAGVVPARLAGLRPLVYVPNSGAKSVQVVDPNTLKVIAKFAVGSIPHHVFPSWDMSTMYVGNTASNSLTQIDRATHKPVRTISVPDPYNLYWPWAGGLKAMVVAERFNRIDFRDPATFKLIKSVSIPWRGIDHGDFAADGRYWLGSTEFTGTVVKIDVVAMKLVDSLQVGGQPIDMRLSPDGTMMFVANQGKMGGVHVVDPDRMKIVKFIKTGRGAHGLQISRDTTKLYVGNRRGASISVIDIATLRVVQTWKVGGSPDMMQLNWPGTRLWVSNRFNASVSVVDTKTGTVIKVIPAGREAHGLTFFPAPGERNTGHNGVYR
jgi:YVTN family beta-propeller protein